MLLPRDVGKTNKSWWLAIPGVSPFIKSLIKGRNAVQQMIKRSKFSELLWSEVESRGVRVSRLSAEYHIHDLVGKDQLERYVLGVIHRPICQHLHLIVCALTCLQGDHHIRAPAQTNPLSSGQMTHLATVGDMWC